MITKEEMQIIADNTQGRNLYNCPYSLVKKIVESGQGIEKFGNKRYVQLGDHLANSVSAIQMSKILQTKIICLSR